MLQLYLPLCQDQLYLPASLPPDVSQQAPSTTQLGRHFVTNPPEIGTKTGLPGCGVHDDYNTDEEDEEGVVYDTDDEDDNNNAEKALPSKPPSHPPLFASATSAIPLSLRTFLSTPRTES